MSDATANFSSPQKHIKHCDTLTNERIYSVLILRIDVQAQAEPNLSPKKRGIKITSVYGSKTSTQMSGALTTSFLY